MYIKQFLGGGGRSDVCRSPCPSVSTCPLSRWTNFRSSERVFSAKEVSTSFLFVWYKNYGLYQRSPRDYLAFLDTITQWSPSLPFLFSEYLYSRPTVPLTVRPFLPPIRSVTPAAASFVAFLLFFQVHNSKLFFTYSKNCFRLLSGLFNWVNRDNWKMSTFS